MAKTVVRGGANQATLVGGPHLPYAGLPNQGLQAQGLNSAPPAVPLLTRVADEQLELWESFGEVHQRMERLADRLLGPVPEAASVASQDCGQGAVSRLEDGVSRVRAVLYAIQAQVERLERL